MINDFQGIHLYDLPLSFLGIGFLMSKLIGFIIQRQINIYQVSKQYKH